jgi:hypothetical protein
MASKDDGERPMWAMRPKAGDIAVMDQLTKRTGLDRTNVIRIALHNEAERLGLKDNPEVTA